MKVIKILFFKSCGSGNKQNNRRWRAVLKQWPTTNNRPVGPCQHRPSWWRKQSNTPSTVQTPEHILRLRWVRNERALNVFFFFEVAGKPANYIDKMKLQLPLPSGYRLWPLFTIMTQICTLNLNMTLKHIIRAHLPVLLYQLHFQL
jgi:hypothetical protein